MFQKGVFCLALFAFAAAQFDRSANEYTIEGRGEPPLTKEVLFTVNDVDAQKKSELPTASIVVGIISSPSHVKEREAVRSTWMQLQSLTDPKLNNLSVEEKQSIVIRFVIGQSSSSNAEHLLNNEALKYHDIVRVPVVESYFNLTLKTGEFLKWAHATYNFKWAMKCDDDSFVRIDTLLQFLSTVVNTKVYMGKMWTGTPVDRRVDSHTPWKEYHRFAAGAGYVLSPDLVAFIVRNYDALHKYPMEDVAVGQWISGQEVHYYDHPHFHSLPEGCDRDMIVQNPASPAVMRETFFNSVRGVPCHTQPDPFDPKTKNVTDHVLLELGIAKPGMDLEEESIADDTMQMAGNQSFLDVDPMMPEEEELEIEQSEREEGMSDSVMNTNTPTASAVQSMNSGKTRDTQMDLEELAADQKMNTKPDFVM